METTAPSAVQRWMVMGMAKHDLITKDFALYVVHYFASMLTWSKEDILSEIDRTIKEAKPADAVPVVRCKDCKHWHEGTGWCNHHSHFVDSDGEACHPHESSQWKMLDADDYCSVGERRTDDG